MNKGEISLRFKPTDSAEFRDFLPKGWALNSHPFGRKSRTQLWSSIN